jgi:FkbM family methyltransferase
MLHKLKNWLPTSLLWQARQVRYRRQIKQDRFISPEPEFRALASFVAPNDWAIDIGANVGHYTKALSDAVGPVGRVIAVEPVPTTFALLAQNILSFQFSNVTLLNVAASDSDAVLNISVPGAHNSKNYYQAHITEDRTGAIDILAVRVDDLNIPHSIRLVKIDAEGHEGRVLLGMTKLLTRDRPTLILEAGPREAGELINSLGYTATRLPGSPNVILSSTAV